MSPDALPRPDRRRRLALKRLGILGQLAGLAVFAGAVYLSGRLGIDMARNRVPAKGGKAAFPVEGPFAVGRSGDPVYFARSPEVLRRFFAAHPTAPDRAAASLSGLEVRRLQDIVEVTPLRVEADALQVRVNSGAMAGAVYWIHHSQIPSATGSDPIISPVPPPRAPTP